MSTKHLPSLPHSLHHRTMTKVKVLATPAQVCQQNTYGKYPRSLHHRTMTTTTMADPNHLGPQPHVARMVQHLHGFADEFTKLSNVPALSEGNVIQNSLAQLTTQINQLIQLMFQTHQRLDRMDQRLDRMDQRLDQIDDKVDTLATRIIAK